MALDEPVEAYVARDAAEAHFVCHLLADAGIEAVVLGESLGAAVGELPPLQVTPSVCVRAADVQRARLVVEDYERHLRERAAAAEIADADARDDSSEPFCYHCGQPVRRGESPCPSCGNALEWNGG